MVGLPLQQRRELRLSRHIQLGTRARAEVVRIVTRLSRTHTSRHDGRAMSYHSECFAGSSPLVADAQRVPLQFWAIT